MTNESICFNKTRFTFSWESDLATQTCAGNYSIDKDTLTLNSDLQLKDLIQVKQHALRELDSLRISIVTVSQVPAYKTTLTIDDSTQVEITDQRGKLLTFPKNYIHSLSVKSDFVDWRISRMEFNIDEATTFIEIILDDTKGLWNAFFDSDKFLIQGNRLVRLDEDNYFFILNPHADCK